MVKLKGRELRILYWVLSLSLSLYLVGLTDCVGFLESLFAPVRLAAQLSKSCREL